MRMSEPREIKQRARASDARAEQARVCFFTGGSVHAGRERVLSSGAVDVLCGDACPRARAMVAVRECECGEIAGGRGTRAQRSRTRGVEGDVEGAVEGAANGDAEGGSEGR